MAYSDSMHISNKISHEILFISSYQSKDMNCARFKYLQEFLEIEIETGPDLSSSGER
jgi:hypothetical protein